jgi:transposase
MDYLEQNNINVLPWPSKSPHLNPIEHIWDQLDKRVRQRQPPPHFRSTLPNVATGMANNTKKQCEKFD